MQTDLNWFMNQSDILNQSISINLSGTMNESPVFLTGIIEQPPVFVWGLDSVIMFLIVITIIEIVRLWYDMRAYKHITGGGGGK